jgi:tetratricopeptide (TPR) repeat protein
MTAFRQRILIMISAAGVTCAVAQPSLEAPASDAETQILAQLSEIEARDGPNSTESIGPLTALALIYQENGRHDLAIGIIERARGVVSVNYGLYSLEEVPLLQMAVRNEEARGNAELGWDLEQELLDLARRYPSAPETYPVYREVARKRADVLADYRGGGFPPQIVLGCYYSRFTGPTFEGPAGSCRAGERGAAIANLRWEVTRYYRQAFDTLLHNDPSRDELRAFLDDVLPVAYRGDANVNVPRAFNRLVEYESRNPLSTPQSRADLVIEVADWSTILLHQLVARNAMRPLVRRAPDETITETEASILEQYKLAYAELEKAGAEQGSIDAIFAPPVPVVLPAFLPNPLATGEAASTGYIDVAFVVSPHGRAEKIEILGSTKSVIRRAEKELVTLIEESSFRPRTTNGQFVGTSPVEVRYYVRSAVP